MRYIMITIFVLGLLAFGSTAIAADMGEKYHITGCEDGELLVPIVHLWERAGPSHIVGKLEGTSKYNKCQGEIVKVLDVTTYNGRVRYKIKTSYGTVGWVSYFFIGRRAE